MAIRLILAGFVRLLPQKRINGFLGVTSDYKAGLFGAALLRRFSFLDHHGIIPLRDSVGEQKDVPQPGIGPGRPEWARDCKSRLSASSSTGAQSKPNVGTVAPAKSYAVPTFSGPFSAALNPSSECPTCGVQGFRQYTIDDAFWANEIRRTD